MMRLLAVLLLALPLAAQSVNVRALLTGPTSGGVYEIPAGVHDLDGLYVKRGHLWGSEDRPVVISGAGPETVLRCPGVCYFEASQWVTFRNLTIEGAINSRHLRNWRFEGVTFRDPDGIGWSQRVLFKVAGGLYPEWNPVDVGAGPVVFERCTFDPSPDGRDTVLDFVGVQGVKILHSTFTRCNRGCLQAKGGSGIREGYEIGWNYIANGGQRGIFLGGGANTEFFDPPLAEARAEFGEGWVHDNTIVGDKTLKSSACFVVGTAAGPVLIEHNLCVGQSGHVMRLIDENQNPLTDEGVRNVTIRRNVFADWAPPQYPNTNVLQTSQEPEAIQWDTIKIDENVFGFPSREAYWGWPHRNPIPTTGNISNAAVEVVMGGKPVLQNWPEYGPRPEVVEQPVVVCVSISTHPDKQHCWDLEQ